MKVGDLTYPSLAERYGVELCTGECAERGHDDGFIARKRVHFRDRGVTRSGLRKFLMLVHDLKEEWGGLPRILPRKVGAAQWIHSRNMYAYRTALHDLGIRLDRKLSATDRAQVRHLLLMQGGAPVVHSLRRWAAE